MNYVEVESENKKNVGVKRSKKKESNLNKHSLRLSIPQVT